MILERASAGLAAAGADGRIGGRRQELAVAKRAEIVVSGRKSGDDAARRYGVGRPTVSRIAAGHSANRAWRTILNRSRGRLP